MADPRPVPLPTGPFVPPTFRMAVYLGTFFVWGNLAAAAKSPGFWMAVFIVVTLVILGLIVLDIRLVFDPQTGRILRRVGLPSLGLAVRWDVSERSRYTHVAWHEVQSARDMTYRALTLEGQPPLRLLTTTGNWGADRAKAAATAIMLELPLVENPGPYGRRERPPLAEQRLLIERALRAETGAGEAACAGAAIVAGNGVVLAGLLGGMLDAATTYLLLWLDAAVLVVFAVLRVAAGNFGREIGRFAQAMIALAVGALALAALGGCFFAMSLEIVPPLPSWRAFGAGAWLSVLMLVAAHAIAFAIEWRRGELGELAQMKRLLGITLLRVVVTVPVAAAVLAGPAVVAALLIAARAGFEVWAYLNLHAPLRASGELALLRAALTSSASRS